MAISNFIPAIWSAGVNTSFFQNQVVIQTLTTTYSGEARDGNTVNVTGAGAFPFTSGGVDGGVRRRRPPCSYANAKATSRTSAHGRPSSSIAVGRPSEVKPAGIAIAGNPDCEDSAQFEASCGAPTSTGR